MDHADLQDLHDLFPVEQMFFPHLNLNFRLGPLIRTTDPKAFEKQVNDLTARGGGDSPEMSLSSLQVLYANMCLTNQQLLCFRVGVLTETLLNPLFAVVGFDGSTLWFRDFPLYRRNC